MGNSVYSTITRQSGLMKEMRVVANNIANMATTGFRSEKAVFSEHVIQLGFNDENLSMARAGVHVTSFEQGALMKTGGTFDLGIEGDGFFQIETPEGVRLTRAGAFSILPTGEIVSPEGYRLLDAGGASLIVPSDVSDISISGDGTVSAGGNPIGQIALVVPSDPKDLVREDGVKFKTASDVLPADEASISQGFLEASNVEAITQVSRMIEVQRSYEMGQSFLEKEDERLRSILTLVGGR